jgi:HTH-type transcriptional regulator/antitoxin HigA
MDIKPVKTEADYESALAEIDSLWGPEPDTPEGDRLDVLMALVEVYEAQHHPVTPPDPVAAILFRMEQQGLTRKDLEPILGSRARVSEILNHKRALSLDMIRKLHNKLHIPLESLVGI